VLTAVSKDDYNFVRGRVARLDSAYQQLQGDQAQLVERLAEVGG